MTLVAVLVLAAGTYALRLSGPLLREKIEVSEQTQRLVGLAAVALIAALVATQALTADGGFAGWARPAGVGVGAVLALRRVPFLLVVVAAATTTAGLRLAGLP